MMSWLESQGFGGLKRASARDSIRQRALALLCVLAVAFQGVVLSSHFHTALIGNDGVEAVATDINVPAGTSDPVRKDRAPAGDPSGCFICQQLALAGVAVLPEAPAPVPVEHGASVKLVSVDVAFVRTATSHNWRSRAPPFLL